MKSPKTARFFRRGMLSLFLLLCGAALYLGAEQGGYCPAALVIAAALFVLTHRFLPFFFTKLSRLGTLRLWAFLTLLCLLIKSAWVLAVRVPVEGDYSVFWGYARQMNWWGMVYGGRYMALFPHIYGYSAFLGRCLRLLGEGELTAQWLNVLFSLLSGTFLFLLFRRNLPAAVFVYLLWAICPSQGLYNTLILPEPLYTTVLLGILLLVGELDRCRDHVRQKTLTWITAGAMTGLLLRWFNMLRPVALIPVIALLLWQTLLTGEEKISRFWLCCLAAMLGVYLLTGPWAAAQVTKMAGEPPAESAGYSVLVGLNQASNGCWNMEDSQILSCCNEMPESTAVTVQRTMLERAKERAFSGEIDYPALLRAKLGVFLSRDDVCVSYCAAGLSHRIRYQLLCNSFWYFSLMLALWGGVQMWRREEGSFWLLAPLYVLGLTLAQMLVEVAGRYHYSLVPILLVIGTWGLFFTEHHGIDTEERV